MMRAMKLDPLVEELIAGTVTMTLLSAFIAFAYWALTGQNPWPYVILAELVAFGFGVGLLALCSPKRQRP